MVYYLLSLIRKNTKIWKKDQICRKLKRRISFMKPIESIVANILEKSRRIKTLEKVYSKYKITEILDEVIGNDYFGTTQNRKQFYYVVNRISTQSRFECVYISFLYKGYNTEAMPWLQHEKLDEIGRFKLLKVTNLFLLRYVVKPLIKHFYHPLNSHKSYEIRFIERPKWHSFQHKVLNELLQVNYLVLTTDKRLPRGELKLFPKTSTHSLDYRPIMYPKKHNLVVKARLKRLSKNIYMFANIFSKIGGQSLYSIWRRYCEETNGQKIHGIILDIKDAFGYVNIDKLCNIIKKSNFSVSDKEFLLNHIRYQYVTFHNKLYRWNHGLLQGDSLSPSFCNLFMSCFEKEYLQEFCKPHCLLHRTVDDYFFCSTLKDDIVNFENKVRSAFVLNDAKTQKTSSINSELCYSGQIFNVQSRQVNKHYSFKKECPIRHRFKLWNNNKYVPESCKHDIIIRAMQFSSNNHCFKNLELNTIFNLEQTVLKNFFEGMVFVAFKFDVAVMAIRNVQRKASDVRLLTHILDNVVCEYSNRVYFKIQHVVCKGKYSTNNITFTILKNIAYRAFIVVLRKRNECYKDVIANIKKNNLYLLLDKFSLPPKTFTSLPKGFENICMHRKSNI